MRPCTGTAYGAALAFQADLGGPAGPGQRDGAGRCCCVFVGTGALQVRVRQRSTRAILNRIVNPAIGTAGSASQLIAGLPPTSRDGPVLSSLQ